MHCSRRLRPGLRSRLGVRGRLGRAGVSPLLRHSPVRAPPPGDDCDSDSPLPLPVPTHGPHEVYLGNWPGDLHELEITALFHKYSIYPTHVHLHRKPMFNGYAFVELACAEDVARAIDHLHGGKVVGHQIVVCRSQPAGRSQQAGRRQQQQQRPDRWTPTDDGAVEEGMFSDAELACKEDGSESPPARPCSPSMPPLVMPAPVAPQLVRHHFSDRDDELYESLSRAKRVCSRREGGGGGGGSPLMDVTGDSGNSTQHDLTGDSGIGQQSARSSATLASMTSDHIRRRLNEPVDVLVANFPAQTAELDLMDLFGRFKPLRVRIMVNEAGQQPGDFTYAYVTVWSTMFADSAVLELDGRLFRGHHLVVEVRRS